MAELADKGTKHLGNGGFVGDMAYQEIQIEFEQLVQSQISAFPEIKVLQATRTNFFNKIKLNRLGTGFDAIRFKNESAETKDFVWVFAIPENSSLMQWNILSSTGPMHPLKTAYEGEPVYFDVPWANSKQRYRTIFQSYPGERIQPYSEYIIWFRFMAAQPEDFYIAANLVPARTFAIGLRGQEITMGVERLSKEKAAHSGKE